MKVAIVIPARYKSSRFEGKPLALIRGKPMIRWVYDACKKVRGVSEVCIATEDDAIKDECDRFVERPTILTSQYCLTGTDRVAEANLKIGADLVINVQGDEPLVAPEAIEAVVKTALRYPGTVINAACPITSVAEYESLNVPKMVFAADGRLFYASRAPIPRHKSGSAGVAAYKQVCIYAIPKALLAQFAACELGKTPVESTEDIEIIRFLELGIPVKIELVKSGSIAVDVPEDIARVEAAMRASGQV